MSRRRLLDDDQAEALYQEYIRWLSLNPKKLRAKYGIGRETMSRYIRLRLARAA